MNSLYTSGVRQTASLQADLERLRAGDVSAPLLGQISASLAAMSRTIDDYESMAKREMIKAKQEKAQMRIQKFRSDYMEFRTQFEKFKADALEQKAASQRAELIAASGTPSSPSDARRRFQTTAPTHSTLHPGLRPPAHQDQSETVSESPFRSTSPYGNYAREFRALDEHSFIQTAENRIDDFLAQGKGVLDNLVDQRKILKGTHKRLLDTVNRLGLSRKVIGWIERRSTQDTYIFVAGAIFTFFCFWLIWHYLG